MIWWIIGASGAAALAGYIALRAFKAAAAARKQVKELSAEIDRRGHIIARMEEVNREASQRKDKMATGSAAERFDASVDIVSDIAKEHPRDSDKP